MDIKPTFKKKIFKQGNSMAIVIPRDAMELAGLVEGDEAIIQILGRHEPAPSGSIEMLEKEASSATA